MVSTRRDFLKGAGLAGVAAAAGTTGAAATGGSQVPTGAHARSVQTDVLDIGYEERGDSAGFPIILLHGFPYDVRAWDETVPPLAAVEHQLAVRPPVEVSAIVLRGTESGFGRPSSDPSGDQARFSALVDRRLVDGAGHDLPAQRPDTVVAALLELLA